MGCFVPYFVRFWEYLDQVFIHFNLGHSYKQNLSVWAIISIYVPRTIWLALSSLILTVLIALPLGIYQASKRNTTARLRRHRHGLHPLRHSRLPVGDLDVAVLQLWLAALTHFPSERRSAVGHVHQSNRLYSSRATLTLLSIAFLSRFMRSAVLEVLVQDYIRTAIAKGCGKSRMLIHHAFRNALGPIVIILGLYFPGLLGGAVVIEAVFNYSGLGIQVVNAATISDVPTVLGITLLVAILTLLGNLMADVALGLVNPRIRIQGTR